MSVDVDSVTIAFRNVAGHEHRVEGVTRSALAIVARSLGDAAADARPRRDAMAVRVEGVALDRMSDAAAAAAIAAQVVAAIEPGGAPWRS